MIRFSRLLLLTLMLIVCATVPAVHAQSIPAQMPAALQTLSNLLGVPVALNDLDQYQWEQNVYPDNTLGCAFAAFPSNQTPTVGLRFELMFHGITYDIRVSGDQTINFACMPTDGGQTIPGVATVPAGGLPETSLAPCPATYAGYLTPHLRIGGQGRIDVGGTPNRLRDAPSLQAAQIGMIQPGSTVTVLAGPSCEPITANGQANLVFWQVRAGSQVGWTAEGLPPNDYFIEAIGGPGLNAERAAISPENAAGLSLLTSVAMPGIRDLDTAVGALNSSGMVALGGTQGYQFLNLNDLSTAALFSVNLPYTGITSIAISPDTRYVAFGFCGVINLVDKQTGAGYGFSLPANLCVNDLAFNWNGTLLAAGIGTTNTNGTPGAGSFVLIDPAHAQEASGITTINTPYSVSDVAFSLDGTGAAYITDNVHWISTATRTETATTALEAPNLTGALAYTTVRFQTSTESATGVSDGEGVRLLSAHTVETFFDIEPNSYPASIAFSPDARLMAVATGALGPAGWDALEIFDLETSDVVFEVPFDDPVSTIQFSPDGTLLLAVGLDEMLVLGIP
ncbi:MAG: hypothetical protein U0670_06600 [Anaerolineae bacterium]